ncbi:protein-disulfide reductase DsbD [Vibrio mediterranei]|uniref:Thiol:disulfide interchange protein DsbD n=1 Tax=Vibrio mediterranei TaxID=689 RepID=A0ABX5D9W5_9VIBR|nr:protein-disulfide reductase DsbD [Vibrio mediterranei]PCD86669.1 protein-disulfide reductase DsbD [Vibrio mediterranei]PRQ66018.1 protein-disulfide reductase DsbD [Vibrio mediterranei]SBO12498.1 Thiol:disulfide interchange protein DsbD precursor [Vibrio mediterranei]
MYRILSPFILLFAIAFSTPSWALFGNSNNAPAFAPNTANTFVPVDEAFPMNFYQQGNKVFIDWQVKEDYYLYQERIAISGENVAIGSIKMEDGTPYKDEFFGDVNIYTEPLFVEVPLSQYQTGAKLIVQYQGCAKAGFCYPPETRVIDISPFDFDSATPLDNANDIKATAADTASTTPSKTRDSELTDKLAQNWWTPALFLLLGIGLAFTPCVLPMYPILTSIVLGGGKRSHKQALVLSLVYVQGMALTYTLLGLVVASAGMQFQAAMQHPYVLIGLSTLFVALSLSMFGLYTLQLPSGLQTWLNNLSNKQQGGNLFGVFAMGAISGLVCSPCTTAPLSGALLYVAQSGDLLTGGIALYALALGMGIPLMAAAVFGNKLLPKAGNWMERVKILFGFVLLAAPIFLLERLLPEFWSTVLWSVLGISAFGWLYHQKNALPFGGWKQSCVGILAILGLFASAQPLLNHWFGSTSNNVSSEVTVSFIQINNVQELNEELAKAKQAGKPVMLDFYADWCVACKEFEKYTFHDASVEPVLSQFVLLQADVTKNQPQDIELLKQMDVLGLPTIEFWDAKGNPVSSARLTGFVPAEDFLQHLRKNQLIDTLSP